MTVRYGVTFQDVPGGSQPSLAQVQGAYGVGVGTPLQMTQVYYNLGVSLSTAFSTGKAGANGASVIVCFKIATPHDIINNVGSVHADTTAFFTDMVAYTNSTPGAVVYWVYWQECDGKSGVRGGAFTAADYVLANQQLQTWANAVAGVSGNAQIKNMVKLTGEAARPNSATYTNPALWSTFLPTGLKVLGFDPYGKTTISTGVNGTDYPAPPWTSLGWVVNSVLTSAAFTGYTGLKWALSEFGSTGLPNPCGSSPPPTLDTGWSIAGAPAWYASVKTYVESITPRPELCCLYSSTSAGNGSITCSGTSLLPSWGFNMIIATTSLGGSSAATAATNAWKSVMLSGSGGGGFIAVVGTLAHNAGAGLTTLAVSPVNLGDVMVLGVEMGTGAANEVTAVSGGGVTTWTNLAVSDPGASAGDSELWYGVVTTTGASTITITTPSGGSNALSAIEFSPGAGYTWSTDGAATGGSLSNVASGTFPALTPSAANELYVAIGTFDGGTLTGATAGFTYFLNYETKRTFVYNTNASSPVVEKPAWGQVAGPWSAVSALLVATPVPALPLAPCELAAYRVA